MTEQQSSNYFLALRYLKISFAHFFISGSLAGILHVAFSYAFGLALQPLGEGAIFLAPVIVPILIIITVASITLGAAFSTKYLSEKGNGLDYRIITAIAATFFAIALGYTYLPFFVDTVWLGALFAKMLAFTDIVDYRLNLAVSIDGVSRLIEAFRQITFLKFEYGTINVALFKDYILPDLLFILSFVLASFYFLKDQLSIILLRDDAVQERPRKHPVLIVVFCFLGIFSIYMFGFILNPAFKYAAVNYKYEEPAGIVRPIFTNLESCQNWTTKKLSQNTYSLADVYDGTYTCEPLLDY